ncbi:lysophosphatidic acid receptor 4-like [Amia ocellicauda]|uniref:lysophosphatidic acid receptor 4-like n=1 Tax=Amia ocellicauda TaxID=2972642 RepID=UPI0034638519
MNNTTDINSAFTASYTIVLIFGVPLNGTALWIFLSRYRLRSPPVIYIANLATADLLFTISLPLRIYYHATGRWPFGEVLCTIITTLFRVNIISSSIFITLISMDRFLAVVYPLRTRTIRTTKFAGVSCGIAWMLMVALGTHIALTHHKDLKSEHKCFKPQKEETIVIVAIVVFLLVILNIFFTMIVIKTLHKDLIDPLRRKNKIMCLFIVNMLIFVVFFLPLSILLTWHYFHPAYSRELSILICHTSFNCCLDPVIYFFSLDALWETKNNTEMEMTPTEG